MPLDSGASSFWRWVDGRVFVALTPGEVDTAAHAAIGRRFIAMEKKFQSFNGSGLGLFEQDIQGACAEASVAKWLDVWWSGTVGSLKSRDAGRLEVRWTKRPDAELLLRPKDDDQAAFVLARGAAPEMELLGWLRAADGKQDRFSGKGDPSRDPCWCVPWNLLRPMPESPRVWTDAWRAREKSLILSR